MERKFYSITIVKELSTNSSIFLSCCNRKMSSYSSGCFEFTFIPSTVFTLYAEYEHNSRKERHACILNGEIKEARKLRRRKRP